MLKSFVAIYTYVDELNNLEEVGDVYRVFKDIFAKQRRNQIMTCSMVIITHSPNISKAKGFCDGDDNDHDNIYAIFGGISQYLRCCQENVGKDLQLISIFQSYLYIKKRKNQECTFNAIEIL